MTKFFFQTDSKGGAFSNLKPLLKENGVIFGSTILGSSQRHTSFGNALMRRFNEPFDPKVPMSGIFSNKDDTVTDLRTALQSAFNRVEITVVGSTALFAASDNVQMGWWADGLIR